MSGEELEVVQVLEEVELAQWRSLTQKLPALCISNR